MPRRWIIALLCWLCFATPAVAQHHLVPGAHYDPAVPAPGSVLGYEIGERFTPHHMIVRYAERLAANSKRIRFDTVAHSFEGRPVLLAIVTSEANHARLTDIQRDIQRLAHPDGSSQHDVDVIVARTPAVLWLGYTVHGGEASGTEAALAFMYQLAAGQDESTKLMLDSTVILIDPVQNPDGHERHVHDVTRTRSTLWVPPLSAAMIHQGAWPGPRTSHYYFDLNRDWYLLSHPETRGRVETFLKWYPQTAVDLHEMGANSTYYFSPPMEPVNPNVPKNIRDWWNIYAAGNAAAFDANGWPFFRREGYDEFYPGYGTSWPIYLGTVGMTYEEASSAGGAIRRTDGTVLTLRDAVARHYTASSATALVTAQRRTQRLRDFMSFRQAAITDAQRAAVRGVIIARDPYFRADSLIDRLVRNGIRVEQTRRPADLRDATPFATTPGRRVPAGSYVIDFAQPNGLLARAILEPEAQLDSAFIREELDSRETGQSSRFYDITAWAMPYAYRVQAWTFRSLPGDLEPIRSPTPPATVPEARVAYAFEPGSEAAIRMLSGLLTDSVRVHLAQRWFRVSGHHFRHGAFVVRMAANDERVHDKVKRHAAVSGITVHALNTSAVDAGTDLGSNSVIPIRIPRVALVGGPGVSGYSFGFAWYQFDQRMHLPITSVNASALDSPAIDEFNVIVVPSIFNVEDAVGESARKRIGDWVRSGGVLITLDGATGWLASEKHDLSRLRARQDSVRADSLPGAPLPAAVPGAIVRVQNDTLSVLTVGVDEREFPVLIFSDRIYKTPKDVRPGEVVLQYAPRERLRISGYLWPEVPARLVGTPYLWTERVGRGRLIAFAADPNFRDSWRGMLPLFANAVLLGGSF